MSTGILSQDAAVSKGAENSKTTGTLSSFSSPARSFRSEKALPNYLRASTGSCHDFCKHGRRNQSEEEKVSPIPRLKSTVRPLSSQGLVMSNNSNDIKRKGASRTKLSASVDAAVGFSHLRASGGLNNVSSRRLSAPQSSSASDRLLLKRASTENGSTQVPAKPRSSINSGFSNARTKTEQSAASSARRVSQTKPEKTLMPTDSALSSNKPKLIKQTSVQIPVTSARPNVMKQASTGKPSSISKPPTTRNNSLPASRSLHVTPSASLAKSRVPPLSTNSNAGLRGTTLASKSSISAGLRGTTLASKSSISIPAVSTKKTKEEVKKKLRGSVPLKMVDHSTDVLPDIQINGAAAGGVDIERTHVVDSEQQNIDEDSQVQDFEQLQLPESLLESTSSLEELTSTLHGTSEAITQVEEKHFGNEVEGSQCHQPLDLSSATSGSSEEPVAEQYGHGETEYRIETPESIVISRDVELSPSSEMGQQSSREASSETDFEELVATSSDLNCENLDIGGEKNEDHLGMKDADMHLDEEFISNTGIASVLPNSRTSVEEGVDNVTVTSIQEVLLDKDTDEKHNEESGTTVGEDYSNVGDFILTSVEPCKDDAAVIEKECRMETGCELIENYNAEAELRHGEEDVIIKVVEPSEAEVIVRFVGPDNEEVREHDVLGEDNDSITEDKQESWKNDDMRITSAQSMKGLSEDEYPENSTYVLESGNSTLQSEVDDSGPDDLSGDEGSEQKRHCFSRSSAPASPSHFSDEYEYEISEEGKESASDTEEGISSDNLMKSEGRRSRRSLLPEENANVEPRRLKFRRRACGEEESSTGLPPRRLRNVTSSSSSASRQTVGPPKVQLRHQDIIVKKESQGLLNNVIEETASKLVKTRKSKVKALVGAFETVMSIHEDKPKAVS